MKLANFSSDEFVDQTVLNSAEALTRDSLLDITGGLHTAGLIGASNLSFSYSGLNITVDAPLPFRALFSDGTLASANGTVDGESSSSATVDFSSLVPSTGSVTAYLVAVSGSVAQEAYSVPGPPVGHPDYNPSFSPYTAYSEQQDTLIFSATTTAPDNTDTLLICSTVLSAGQTTITTSSTTGQVRAGAILSRNGEVLAADLASGAAATNVGTLGGSLVGTLPNPTLTSTGATSGTYINPISVTVDSDGRISAISNVDNFDVPGNVTAGGDIVASGTVSGASATSNGNLIPYGQAFQLLTPTGSETITLGNTLKTEVMPNITAAATFTLEPGSVVGQSILFFGGADAVTVQTNVTTGSPYLLLPDDSGVYSWIIPAAEYPQGIELIWDGVNWNARTFGQTVVAPATQNNAAVQLGQVQQTSPAHGVTSVSSPAVSTTYTASVSITAPAAGYLSVFGRAYCDGVLNGNSITLSVNGTSVGDDTTDASSTTIMEQNFVAVTAGTAYTVETSYATGSTAPSGSMTIYVDAVFLPNP